MANEEDVLTIEDGVVTKCKKDAVSVVIPEGVTEIGDNAFGACTSLKSAVIANGVKQIGFAAFRHCIALESLLLPATLTKIGTWALYNCKALSEIKFAGTVAQWEAVEGKGVFKWVTPNSVKCSDGEWQKGDILVENGALYCFDKNIKNIVIGSDVMLIESYAFSGCTSLKSVVIPESVKGIGYNAFEYCKSLTEVVIPEGVIKIFDNAFYCCKALKSISLPSTLTKIGENVFEECEYVEKIESASPLFPFDKKTKKLYDATGKRRKAILTLAIWKAKSKKEKIEKMQSVSSSAVLDSILSEHKAQTQVFRDEKKKNIHLRIKALHGGIEILLSESKVADWMKTLPFLLDFAAKGVDVFSLKKYADDNAFEDASQTYLRVTKSGNVTKKYTEISPLYLFIPSSLGITKIGEEAFWAYGSLKLVVISDGVTEIRKRAFSECSSLETVVIPQTVTSIGKDAFSNCTSLVNVEFGGTLAQWEEVKDKVNLLYFIPATSVKCSDGEWKKGVVLVEGRGAIKCLDRSVKSVVIEDGVKKIDSFAFAECKSLESVVIPEGVDEIDWRAFYNCKSLKSVVIPSSVTTIRESAFADCSSLEYVEFRGTVEQWKAVKKEIWSFLKNTKCVKCADGDVELEDEMLSCRTRFSICGYHT